MSRKNDRRTLLTNFSWNIEKRFGSCDDAAWAKAAIKIRWFQPTARARSPFVSRSSIHAHTRIFLHFYSRQNMSLPCFGLSRAAIYVPRRIMSVIFFLSRKNRFKKKREGEAAFFLRFLANNRRCSNSFAITYLSFPRKHTFSVVSYAHHIMSNTYLYVQIFSFCWANICFYNIKPWHIGIPFDCWVLCGFILYQ